MDIESNVIEALRKVKEMEYERELYDLPLTGRFFRFDEIDMVYLTLELMSSFGITFLSEDVTEYKMNTINGIIKIIEKKLS